MTNGGIIVFFYVDDITFTYQKHDSQKVQEILSQLRDIYKLTGGGPL